MQTRQSPVNALAASFYECVGRSADALVFLQRADVIGPRLVRIELRPLRPRHLANIKIAARVHGHAVRAEERGGRRTGMPIAKTRQEIALVVDDADPWPEIAHV